MILNEIYVFVSNVPCCFFCFKDNPVYPSTSSVPGDAVAGDIIGKFLVVFAHIIVFSRVTVFHCFGGACSFVESIIESLS